MTKSRKTHWCLADDHQPEPGIHNPICYNSRPIKFKHPKDHLSSKSFTQRSIIVLIFSVGNNQRSFELFDGKDQSTAQKTGTPRC